MSALLTLCGLLQALPTAAPSAAEIDQLVRQLGSPQFEEREAAVRRLEDVGEPALEPLRKAMSSMDPEVRRRARALVESIESRDYQKLVGTWECVPEGSPRLVVGDGGRIVFVRGTRTVMTFILTPLENPKGIDFHVRGQLVVRGLYALKGDELQLCLPTREERRRPKAFASAGDAECITLSFKRLKADPETK
jgi:uncharacterized protein (TIGR03067 family)